MRWSHWKSLAFGGQGALNVSSFLHTCLFFVSFSISTQETQSVRFLVRLCHVRVQNPTSHLTRFSYYTIQYPSSFCPLAHHFGGFPPPLWKHLQQAPVERIRSVPLNPQYYRCPLCKHNTDGFTHHSHIQGDELPVPIFLPNRADGGSPPPSHGSSK